MNGRARIVQISVSAGGVAKRAVSSARGTRMGLEDDTQRNRKLHGGPDRALCLFSKERICILQAEGHPIAPGSIGENLTIEGIDWSRVAPGTYLRFGDHVVAEVTDYTAPCFNIKAAFHDRDHARVLIGRP
jgi:MOSC domain-containing protein YiiM